jgi:ferric hydroxamate transport system substrate-binding protein
MIHRASRLTRREVLAGALHFAALPAAAAEAPISTNAPPTRIAAPDRASAQALLSMQIVPVASVSHEFYGSMGGALALPAEVVSCGEPIQPNLEVLRSLDVQLIVTTTINDDVRTVLDRVAPVFAMNIYNGTVGALDRARSETRRLAALLEATQEAERYITAVNSTIELGRGSVRAHPTGPMFLVSFGDDGRNMNVFGKNSLMFDVMKEFNIENAWTGKTSAYGIAIAGVEELAENPAASILHIDYGATTDEAMRRLESSPFWRALPMVKQKRVFKIAKFDALGGLPAAAQFASALADTLLEAQSA